MRAKHSKYLTARKNESRNNPAFRKAQHRIHLLMNIFLAVIAGEWMIMMLLEGASWTGAGEILLTLALHFLVETLALHGYAALGGGIIVVDELLNAAGLYITAQQGHMNWHIWMGAICSVLLLGIALYLIFSRDIQSYAHRAREILRAHYYARSGNKAQ